MYESFIEQRYHVNMLCGSLNVTCKHWFYEPYMLVCGSIWHYLIFWYLKLEKVVSKYFLLKLPVLEKSSYGKTTSFYALHLLQEASAAIPLFSPVIVPMAQSFGPILSQLTSYPTIRFGVRYFSVTLVSKLLLEMLNTLYIGSFSCLHCQCSLISFKISPMQMLCKLSRLPSNRNIA